VTTPPLPSSSTVAPRPAHIGDSKLAPINGQPNQPIPGGPVTVHRRLCHTPAAEAATAAAGVARQYGPEPLLSQRQVPQWQSLGHSMSANSECSAGDHRGRCVPAGPAPPEPTDRQRLSRCCRVRFRSRGLPVPSPT
jgi:hypothetical protein